MSQTFGIGSRTYERDPGVQPPGPLYGTVDVVQDYGARGDGVEDDTHAFLSAAAWIKSIGGGQLYVPAGLYKVSASIPLSSRTTVAGSGFGSRIIVAAGFVNPGSGRFSVFRNENHEAAAITDEQIVVRDLAFDDSANPAHGAFHHVKFRYCRTGRVFNCHFIGGGDAVAIRASTDVLVQGNFARDFTNCAYDAWEQSNDIAYIGNYAKTASAAQFANFNPETEPPYATGTISRRFRMIGNTFDGTGSAPVIPCQIEQLSANGTIVEDVTIVGNTFRRGRLAIRGNVRGATIANNTFSDVNTSADVILVYPFVSGTPQGIIIANNDIRDAGTTGANGGVIRCQVDDAVVVGNIIGGTNYTGQAVYVGSAKPTVLGNVTDPAVAASTHGLPKTLRHGFRLINGSDHYIGIEDASGTALKVFVQNDDNLIVQGTDSGGANRTLLSIYQRADASLWRSQPGFEIGIAENNYFRLIGDSAASGPALQALGTDTDIPLRLASKGASPVVVTNVGLAFSTAAGPSISWGTGSPEGVTTAPVGSLYLRTDGGASTSVYVKESGAGNTGWAAK